MAYGFKSDKSRCSIFRNNWVKVGTLPQISNGFNGATCVYNNRLFCLGGTTSSVAPYAFWEITAAGGQEYLSSGLPYEVYNGSAVAYGSRLHLLGGGDENGNGSTHHYQWDGSSWSQISTLPFDFYGTKNAVVYNGKIHILCGDNHYSWNGGSWTQESAHLPINVVGSAVVVYGGKVHIIGGGNSGYKTHYSWDGLTWTNEGELPYAFRDGGAVVYSDKLLIIGSEEDSISDTPPCEWDGVMWKTSSFPQNFGTAYDMGLAVWNNAIYLIGGYGRQHHSMREEMSKYLTQTITIDGVGEVYTKEYIDSILNNA